MVDLRFEVTVLLERFSTSFPSFFHPLSQDGYSSPGNAVLALELFRAASSRGDPEAQGQMGVRYALGLQSREAWDERGIAAFGEVTVMPMFPVA
jgi:hypothetical protein